MTPPETFELVKVHDGLAYIAGHGPFDGATPLVQGLVGRDLTVDEAYEAARMTGMSIVASLRTVLGDLDRVTQWIRAVGYVHCEPGFGRNATVVNGFSDLIVELWGDAGRHVRSAPGQGPPSTSRSSSTLLRPSTDAVSGGVALGAARGSPVLVASTVGERHPVDGEDHLRFTEADAGSLSAVAPMPSKTARSYLSPVRGWRLEGRALEPQPGRRDRARPPH
ncbi:MAG: RidA family protein [Gaiellaceae bacterium]